MLTTSEIDALEGKLEELNSLLEEHKLNPELLDAIKGIKDKLQPVHSRISIAKKEYELVEEWVNNNPSTCVYCGDSATEKDHLLPLPWTGLPSRALVPKVPACRSCNRTLGDFPNPMVFERCQLIADSIEDPRYVTLRAGGAANV